MMYPFGNLTRCDARHELFRKTNRRTNAVRWTFGHGFGWPWVGSLCSVNSMVCAMRFGFNPHRPPSLGPTSRILLHPLSMMFSLGARKGSTYRYNFVWRTVDHLVQLEDEPGRDRTVRIIAGCRLQLLVLCFGVHSWDSHCALLFFETKRLSCRRDTECCCWIGFGRRRKGKKTTWGVGNWKISVVEKPAGGPMSHRHY